MIESFIMESFSLDKENILQKLPLAEYMDIKNESIILRFLLPVSPQIERSFFLFSSVMFPMFARENLQKQTVEKKWVGAICCTFGEFVFKDIEEVEKIHLDRLFRAILFYERMVETLMSSPEKKDTFLMKVDGERCFIGYFFHRGATYITKEQIQKVLEKQVSFGTVSCEFEEALFSPQRRILSFKMAEGATLDEEEALSIVTKNISEWNHPLLSPQNDEEVMKQILQLSQEVRYLEDLPQVIISFREQTRENLVFHVIFCRLNKTDTSIESLFSISLKDMEITVEQVRDLGKMRNKYPKEAGYISIRVPKSCYYRADFSIDLVRARDLILETVKKAMGPLRDFSGGLISREKVSFTSIQEYFSTKKHNKLLLENIYYGIQPHMMRTLIEPEMLFDTYQMANQMLNGSETFMYEETDEKMLLFLRSLSNPVLRKIEHDIASEGFKRYDWAISIYRQQEYYYLCVLYCGKEMREKHKFLAAFFSSVETHLHVSGLSEITEEGEKKNGSCREFHDSETKKLIANI